MYKILIHMCAKMTAMFYIKCEVTAEKPTQGTGISGYAKLYLGYVINNSPARSCFKVSHILQLKSS